MQVRRCTCGGIMARVPNYDLVRCLSCRAEMGILSGREVSFAAQSCIRCRWAVASEHGLRCQRHSPTLVFEHGYAETRFPDAFHRCGDCEELP